LVEKNSIELIVFDVKRSHESSPEIDHSIKAWQKHGHGTGERKAWPWAGNVSGAFGMAF